MSAIDAVKAHYESFSGANRRSIEVPEWVLDGKPIVVYWDPVTVKVATAAIRAQNSGAEGIAQFNTSLVISMACDVNGARLFDGLNDALLLTSYGAFGIVNRIANAMLTTPKMEDALKN